MSEIKALEKLRNSMGGYGHGPNYFVTLKETAFDRLCDEIQTEVDERFMERPCDKNGEPTYIGQRIKHRGHEGEVWLLGVHEVMCSDHVCYPCGEYEHVKPRTLEDVLDEICDDQESIARAAAEIRELLGVDA